jgi:hypothetical protein
MGIKKIKTRVSKGGIGIRCGINARYRDGKEKAGQFLIARLFRSWGGFPWGNV